MVVKCIGCGISLNLNDRMIEKDDPLICPNCKTKFKPSSVLNGRQEPAGREIRIDGSLHLKSSELPGFRLKEGRQIVGRKSADRPCDIMIETSDTSMSRKHFSIEVARNNSGGCDYYVSDLGSLNHTLLNSTEIVEGKFYRLKNNDVIQAGETVLVFKNPSDELDTVLMNKNRS